MPGTEYLNNSNSQIELMEISLGNEYGAGDNTAFCIDVAKIREILRGPELTRLPNMPDGIFGIFSLRNQIIPVLDMAKIILGIENAHPGKLLIISEFSEIKFGFTIHGPGDIFRLKADKIELPENDITDFINSDAVYGRANYVGKNYFIIDTENIIVNTNLKKALAYDNSDFSLPEISSAYIIGRSVLIKDIVKTKLTKAGIAAESFGDFRELLSQERKANAPAVIVCSVDLNDPAEIKAIEKMQSINLISRAPMIFLADTDIESMREKAEKIDRGYVISEASIGSLIEIIHRMTS